MTVGELRKKLEYYDENLEIVMNPSGSNYIYRIDFITLNDLPSNYKYGEEEILLIK